MRIDIMTLFPESLTDVLADSILGRAQERGYLTIEAHRDESNDKKDDSGNYIRRERHTGTISRSFYIDNIDETGISAQFNAGVLKVSLPKAPEVQRSSRIEIK